MDNKESIGFISYVIGTIIGIILIAWQSMPYLFSAVLYTCKLKSIKFPIHLRNQYGSIVLAKNDNELKQWKSFGYKFMLNGSKENRIGHKLAKDLMKQPLDENESYTASSDDPYLKIRKSGDSI